MKTVAVILINYNGIDDTMECVDRLLKSSASFNLKIVKELSKDYLLKVKSKKREIIKKGRRIERRKKEYKKPSVL